MPRDNTSSLNHPWDRAKATVLVRTNGAWGDQEKVDPGVNFFVLALEALGATPKFSCEGHPTGFYVTFEASYELAREIEAAGFFTVEISRNNGWVIRKGNTERIETGYTERDKEQTLRWATEAWISRFGDRLASLECLKKPA